MDDEHRADPQPAGDDDVAPLLHLAGRRPRLPEEEVAPLRAQAREVFRRQARRTAMKRRLGWTAAAGLAAAGLLLVIGPIFRRLSLPSSSEAVATFELRTGEVTVSDADGQALFAGAVIETGDNGRVALRLPAGGSVRIDGGSTVRFDSPRTLTLGRGAVYADSGAAATPARGIEIATVFGSIRDVGTQFEVRLLPEAKALRVRVREGKVLVDQAGEIRQAGTGAELILEADGGFQSAVIPVYGADWDWVQRAAPALAIEGASLADFLAWVSRETGLRWRLAEPGAGKPPEEVILHGSIEGLTAEESLAVVLPSCGYRHRRVGGELWLEWGPSP
jgi:hypothetical protein